jgi:hypothetical protein
VPPTTEASWTFSTAAKAVLVLMLASRLSLLAVGLLASSLVPSGSGHQPGNLIWHPAAPAPLEIWARWDAEWYLLIADEG